VCLSGLRQLTIGWIAYADGNNDKLVNGSPQIQEASPGCPLTDVCKAKAPTAAQDADHPGELAWIGHYNLTTPPISTECGKKSAIDSGAMWKYLRDYKIYRCPTGMKNETITYAMVDGVNGRREGRGSSPAPDRSIWKKNLLQIKKTSKQVVFVDEGRVSPDSFAVVYSAGGWRPPGVWFDGPDSRHGDGTTVSLADGHAEYWKWCLETAKRGREVEAGTASGDFPLASSPDAAFQDLYKMTLYCWGKLAFSVTGHPPKVN